MGGGVRLIRCEISGQTYHNFFPQHPIDRIAILSNVVTSKGVIGLKEVFNAQRVGDHCKGCIMVLFLLFQKGTESSSTICPPTCLSQPMGDSFWSSTQLQHPLLWDTLGTKQDTEKPPVKLFVLHFWIRNPCGTLSVLNDLLPRDIRGEVNKIVRPENALRLKLYTSTMR